MIDDFMDRYQPIWLAGMRNKLGLEDSGEDDLALTQELLQLMADHRADFTLTFRALSEVDASDSSNDEDFKRHFEDADGVDAWLAKWRRRLALEGGPNERRQENMRRANPRFIPRNHLVEQAIDAAMQDDFGPFEDLVAVLSSPFEDQPGKEAFATPPRPDQIVQQTFCGT